MNFAIPWATRINGWCTLEKLPKKQNQNNKKTTTKDLTFMLSRQITQKSWAVIFSRNLSKVDTQYDKKPFNIVKMLSTFPCLSIVRHVQNSKKKKWAKTQFRYIVRLLKM
jgi:hypothetical protein